MTMLKKTLAITAAFLLVVALFVLVQESHTQAAAVNLSDPVFSDFNKILFVKAQQGNVVSEHHMVDQYFGFNAWTSASNGLFILNNAFSGNKYVTNVLENSYCQNGRYAGRKLQGGGFLSPDLSYDGTKIVFAYTDGNHSQRWDQSTTYHLFSVNIDGSDLRQLTDGNYNDMMPAWMPDGTIVFISERRDEGAMNYGRCHQRPVPNFTLHTMNADGSNIRCISYHETNEWWPAIDNDGMIVYTRWDYVDRGATHTHNGWITKPDGINPKPISLNYTNTGRATAWGFGNVPLMQMQLRPIPGSSKYVAVGAPHHFECYGPIIIIDPDVEDDDRLSTITNITPDNNGYPESSTGQHKYGTPYALSENFFLVAHSPSNNDHYGLYVIDRNGNKTLLYDDPSRSIQSPIPVRPRKAPPMIAGTQKPEGAANDIVMNLVNVYDSLLPWPNGTKIVALRIWEPYVKTTQLATTPMISYESTASIWSGRNAKGLLGTVPVEEDGSARFYLPANRPYYFQAINEDGLAVQSMRSDAYGVGGQFFQYCDGCHEPRHQASINDHIPMAFLRPPDKVTPDPVLEAKNGRGIASQFLSFPRLIQPILDSKCTSCHNGSQRPDLRKGNTDANGWFASYNNLKPYVWLVLSQYPGSTWDRSYPRTEPGKFGAMASSLYKKLATDHGNLSEDELHSFVIWLDSGIAQFYGDYQNASTQRNGGVVTPLAH
ncbi:MAG: PD40 domain-containing protein [Spirochaetales bacterium]|nr:PD40 domain-containing protein [Spirochaetales bacterium]